MTKGQKVALGILVGVPLVCGFGGMAVMNRLFGAAASERDRELARARADGIPMSPAELAKLCYVPDAQNAAPDFEKLQAIFADRSPARRDLGLVSAGLSRTSKPKDRATAVDALARLQPDLALARQASTLPHCDFRRDWAKGAALIFPEYSTIRGLTTCFVFEAEQRSRAGDWRGALDDLSVGERISHQVREEPILIALLVSLAIEAIVDSGYRAVINDHPHDAEFLDAARRTHDQFGPLGDMHRGLMGEVVMDRVMLKRIRTFSELNPDAAPRTATGFERALVQSPIIQGAWDARLVRSYRQVIEALPTDPARWEDGFRAAQAADLRAAADHSLAGLAGQLMLPVFAPAAETIGLQLARRNLTDTVLRILQDRARTGRLPAALPDYGPTRMDPFSGKPLIYRREGNGFILYSVGRDRVDNGGKEVSEGRAAGEGYDEVFRVR